MKRVIALILLMIFVFSCSKKEGYSENIKKFNLKVSPVLKRYFSSEESYMGNVVSKNRVNISTRMMGRILSIKTDIGKEVKKGELLVEIDTPEAESGYRQAKAMADSALVYLNNMERDYERFKRLYEEKAVTKHQLEQVEAGFANAKAQYEQAKASLDMAKDLLLYGKIYSPINGIVTKKFVDEGNIVGPGMPILTIEDPESLEINIEVPEEKAEKIKVGSKALVYLNEEELRIYPVKTILKTADYMTKTSTVKIEVDNQLKVGKFVKVKFNDLGSEALSIPKEAIKREGQIELVFVLRDDNKATIRIIKTGRYEDGYYEVLSGLMEGEKIVLNPPYDLREGDLVEVKND